MWVTLWRWFIHFWVGVLNALLLGILPAAGVVFALGFIIYQVNEDLHCRDRAYPDLAGWLAGLAAATIARWILPALFTC